MKPIKSALRVPIQSAMANFKGTMTIVGSRGSSVPVDAEIVDQMLVLKVERVDVGSWALQDVHAEPSGAGVSLQVGGETVVIDVTDRRAFLGALQAPVDPKKRDRRKKPKKPKKHERGRRRLPSLAVILTFSLLAGVASTAILFPEVVGPVLILVGLVTLVVAASAHAEVRVALRLPFGLRAGHFLIVGLVLTGAGVGVTLLA